MKNYIEPEVWLNTKYLNCTKYMKFHQLIEANDPSGKDQYMNNYRVLHYRDSKANKKFGEMATKKVLKPYSRDPTYKAHEHMHEIEHMGMGIEKKPENEKLIADAKTHAKKINAHRHYVTQNDLPNDLTHDELEEIRDNLYDGLYELDHEAEGIYDQANTSGMLDGKGYFLLLTRTGVDEHGGDEAQNYVQVFYSHDTILYTRKENIGKHPIINRLVKIGQEYQAWHSRVEQITARMEWIEKGERNENE